MFGLNKVADKSETNDEYVKNESGIDVDLTLNQHQLDFSELELLKKMLDMNRANEQDSRSVVSGYGTGTSISDTRSHVSAENGPLNHSGEDESQVDDDLLCTWGDLVQNWVDQYNQRPQYIHSLVRRGIPSHFRSSVWQLLVGADVESVRELYSKLIIMESELENRIRHDISKCQYSQHRIINESAIFNVVKAYILHRKEILCPLDSFVYVVQSLLSQMPEPETFAVLLYLMDPESSRYKFGSLYNGSMTNLAWRLYQFEYFLRSVLPKLHAHLSKVQFDACDYVRSWFLTFFVRHLSIELSNRIIDIFICEGIDVLFRLAIAALSLCQGDLLRLDAQSLHRYFQFEMSQKLDQDHDLLIDTAFELGIDKEKMTGLEKEFMTTKSSPKEDQEEDEEVMELRKIRIANALLRQRITRLEEESSFLTDELIAIEPGQSELESEENGSKLRMELGHLRRCNADIHKRLEEAEETIKELTPKVERTADKEIQVDDQPTIEHIHLLQVEVIEVRAREANFIATTKDLRIRARELDLANEKLKSAPDHECLTSLQNEVAEIRQREFEANQLLSETRQKIKALHEDWQHFMSKQPQESEGPVTDEEIHQQIMGALIREADALAELKEARQRVMELETQNHVFGNQIRRQNEEYQGLEQKIDSWPANERVVQSGLRETQRKLADAEARLKEEAVLARLREAELLGNIAELKQQISEMESSYFEKWTQEEIKKDGLENQSFDDFEDDDDDDTETLDGDGVDSSYHSGEVTTEDDYESSNARAGLKDLRKQRYEVLPNMPVMGGLHG